jgi:hypothetical protein
LVSKIGAGTVKRIAPGVENVGYFTWTDGTTIPTETDALGGLAFEGVGNGLQITVTPDEPMLIDLWVWRRDVSSKITLTAGAATKIITENLTGDVNSNTPLRLSIASSRYSSPLTIKLENVEEFNPGGISALHAIAVHKTAPAGSADLNAVWEYTTTETENGTLHLSGSDWDIPSEDGISVIRQLHNEFNYTVSYNVS